MATWIGQITGRGEHPPEVEFALQRCATSSKWGKDVLEAVEALCTIEGKSFFQLISVLSQKLQEVRKFLLPQSGAAKEEESMDDWVMISSQDILSDKSPSTVLTLLLFEMIAIMQKENVQQGEDQEEQTLTKKDVVEELQLFIDSLLPESISENVAEGSSVVEEVNKLLKKRDDIIEQKLLPNLVSFFQQKVEKSLKLVSSIFSKIQGQSITLPETKQEYPDLPRSVLSPDVLSSLALGAGHEVEEEEEKPTGTNSSRWRNFKNSVKKGVITVTSSSKPTDEKKRIADEFQSIAGAKEILTSLSGLQDGLNAYVNHSLLVSHQVGLTSQYLGKFTEYGPMNRLDKTERFALFAQSWKENLEWHSKGVWWECGSALNSFPSTLPQLLKEIEDLEHTNLSYGYFSRVGDVGFKSAKRAADDRHSQLSEQIQRVTEQAQKKIFELEKLLRGALLSVLKLWEGMLMRFLPLLQSFSKGDLPNISFLPPRLEDSLEYKENMWYLPTAEELWNDPAKRNLVPSLRVLIIISGTQGDVQPFLVAAKGLIRVGHQIRMATHEPFRDFVAKKVPEIEFVDIGGNPREMMKYVVDHPKMVTLNPKDLKMQTKNMNEIIEGSWRACLVSPDSSPQEGKDKEDVKVWPDVIICNPPVPTHIHLAERLGVPLQIWFPMPWTQTQSYRHPFASFLDFMYDNEQSYTVLDNMMWAGTSSTINSFRKNRLQLPAILKGAHLVREMKVPHVYLFSKHLVPRPPDWGPEISIAGFMFLEQEEQRGKKEENGDDEFVPDQDLEIFLRSGSGPIVYVGFGSIVLNDVLQKTHAIYQALESTPELRMVISKGWSGIGELSEEEAKKYPPSVLERACVIGPCPHSWLFDQVSVVCHHGGAGTTSTGLRHGRPTIVVPFFGDQPFWGQTVFEMGVGASPIPQKAFDGPGFEKAIRYCLGTSIQEKAEKLGELLRSEDSQQQAVDAFHRYLPLDSQGNLVKGLFEHSSRVTMYRMLKHRFSDLSGKLFLPDPRDPKLPTGWEYAKGGEWQVDKEWRNFVRGEGKDVGEVRERQEDGRIALDSNGWEYSDFPFADHWYGAPNYRRTCQRRRWVARLRKKSQEEES